MLTLSTLGARLIKDFEGCELVAYRDAQNKVAVGYGHTGGNYKVGDVITQQQANDYFNQDIASTVTLVNNLFVQQLNLNQNQFDAFVSLCYNVGCSAVHNSALYVRLLAKDSHAWIEFYHWISADGKILRGLVSRRQAEMNLFNTPTG